LSALTFRRVHLWLPPVIYMAAIFHFSSQSDPLPTLTANVWDKLLHTMRVRRPRGPAVSRLTGEGLTLWQASVATVLLVSGYGATDEWHQVYVPLRSPDVQDWMTDTLAGGIGTAACVAFMMWRRRLRAPSGLSTD